MVRRKRSKPIVLASYVGYIDPAGCGSTVGYALIKRHYGLDVQMDLSDCNRRINWNFDNDSALSKIDKVLEIFNAFRVELLEAQKKYKKKK